MTDIHCFRYGKQFHFIQLSFWSNKCSIAVFITGL